MAKGKSTWKYNKLLTARRNYFAFGTGNRSNPLGLDFTSAAYHGYRGNAKATADFVRGANANGAGIDPNNLPGSLGGGSIQSSNANTNKMGLYEAIGSIGMQAVSDIGGMINNIQSNDIADRADQLISEVNSAQMKTQSSSDTFDALTSDWLNNSKLKNVTAKQLGAKSFGQGFGDALTAGAQGAAAGTGLGPWGMAASAIGSTATSIIGNIFRNKKAQKEADRINSAIDYVNDFNERSLINRGENLANSQMQNLLGNYAAFGGPMDFGGAIEYDFMNQYLDAKRLAALGQNSSIPSLPNSFAEGGGIHIKKANRGKFTEYCGGKVTSECIARGKRSSSPAVRKRATFAGNARKWKHAFGGNLLTHGSNFDTGVILIGNGGSHEENPYEGVPMGVDSEGTPNLVEQGEVIFKDYVFSNRLTVPNTVRNKYKLRGTKPLTFAAAAKQLSKEAEERPNDPISKAGIEVLMSRLASDQEGFKAERDSRKFAKGGHLFGNGGTKAEDTPERLAQNRYWLRGKNGPTPLEVTPWEGLNEQGKTFAEVYPNLKFYGKQERPYDESTNTTFTDYYYDPVEIKEETPEEEPDVTSPEYEELPTWMRFSPVVGLGLGVLSDAFKLTNRPDYSNADAILEATRGAGNYMPIKASPIGNYLRYTPFDREFYINQMNAQSGATRRAIMQNAGLNRGVGIAALLASDYNSQNQLGQLARQAEEYNLAQRQQVGEFNRATDMFNAEKALQADMANQSAQASMRDFNLRGTMAAAEMREKARLASEAAKSANISGFINAIGDIGRENMAWNWRNFGLSTGSFGNVGDTEAKLLTHTGKKKTKAKRGKTKR